MAASFTTGPLQRHDVVMATTKTSGRFSRFPAVNRNVPAGSAAPAPQVAAGAPQPAPTGSGDGDSVPVVSDLTTAEVLAWVDGDVERAAKAYAAESDGKARKSLLDALSKIVG